VELPALGAVDVGLRGRHQAANVAVADAMLDALGEAGIADVPPDARREGYAAARWPGRLELLTVPVAGGAREVLLDGAHNPDGAAALALALDDLRPHLAGGDRVPSAPLSVVWASMRDKDVPGVVAAVSRSRALDGATVLCTAVDALRALPADELAAAWRAGNPRVEARTAGTPAQALAEALRLAPGPVVVAGSLYLIGEVRGILVDDPALRDPDEA
jgi:dihydrofolate synthase/folylpolyglutamate synthase